MRKVTDINQYLEQQIEYYETNTDYSDNYLDFLGDTLQYDGVYNEEDIYRILDNELTTSTDYSYGVDNSVAVFPVGEIEIQIDTNLTQKEYNAIEHKINYPSKYNGSLLLVYICAGMNVRVYSDAELKAIAWTLKT